MARAMIGEVEFDVVESESPNYSTQVTSRPVESGIDITDHVKANAITMPISGVVAGDDAAQKLQQIRRYNRNGDLVTYIGRNVLQNCVITSLDTNHDVSVRNGFSFTISLQQIRIATTQTINLLQPAVRETQVQQVKPVENKGTQQIQEKTVDPAREEDIRSKIDAKLALIGR